MDDDAYKLYVDMVVHRAQVLRFRTSWGEKESSTTLEWKCLARLEQELKDRFNSLKRHYQSISWPINVGREVFDHRTDIPPVHGPFQIARSDNDTERHCGIQAAGSIWASFTSTLPVLTTTTESDQFSDDPEQQTASNRPRLSAFQDLAQGESLQGGEKLRFHRVKDSGSVLAGPQSSSIDAWKSILLFDSENVEHPNEWDILKDHYNIASGSAGPDSPQSSNIDDSDKSSGSPSLFRGLDLPLSARALFPSSSSDSD